LLLTKAKWGKIIGFSLPCDDTKEIRSEIIGQVKCLKKIKKINSKNEHTAIYKYLKESVATFDVMEFKYAESPAVQALIAVCLERAKFALENDLEPTLTSNDMKLKHGFLYTVIANNSNIQKSIQDNEMVQIYSSLRDNVRHHTETFEKYKTKIKDIMYQNKILTIIGEDEGVQINCTPTMLSTSKIKQQKTI
jgi:hypothetical protein